MTSSLASSLLSPKFIKLWLPTVAAIIIFNFTIIVYHNDVYTKFRRTKWNPPVEKSDQQTMVSLSLPPSPPPPTSLDLIASLYKPRLHPVDWPNYVDFEGIEHDMNNDAIWTKSLGSRLCIVDIDTRPLNKSNQIMNAGHMNWDSIEYTAAGMLNHYLYAKIHGYTYHSIHTTPLPDRSAFWTKIPALAKTLSQEPSGCDMTVSIDADATFMNLDLPLEWLFNRWNITKTTSLTLPIDPDQPNNKDRAHGQTNLNCGLVIAQNSPRTHEILQAWEDCPDDEERFPGCDKWKTEWPAEQAAFGEYIRYEFDEEDDVKSIPCDEANGFPGNPFGECNGVFVRHHWSDKDLVKGVVGDEILRVLMGAVHRDFVRDKGVVVDGGREEQEEEELDGDVKEVEDAFPGERFAGEAFAREAFGRKL